MHTLPVLSFVVEHARALLVFDTGLNAAFATDAREYVGWLTDRLIPFRSSPGMNLSAQMRGHGLAPEDVSHVVLSHLHYDHTGDLRAFPQAKLLLARREWEAAQSPLRRLRGYLHKEYSGLAFSLLDYPSYAGPIAGGTTQSGYGLDLMGDGTSPRGCPLGRRHRLCARGLYCSCCAAPRSLCGCRMAERHRAACPCQMGS